MCDLKAIEIILTFAVGGITLRVLIEVVKNRLKLSGLGAVFAALAMCLVASAAYLVITGAFDWMCLFVIGFNVFAGTQVAYRATHG